jgi:polar amino acid transport system substrate-binding protein
LWSAAIACERLPAAELDEAASARVVRRLGGVLRWGGDAEGGAPYQFLDPKDPRKIIGFEVDLIEAVAKGLAEKLHQRLRPEFVQYQWETLPLGLTKGDFDVIASGLETTAQNRAKILFSRPYYVYSQQLVVRADEPDIKSLADCRGHPIGTLGGSAAERLLAEYGMTGVRAYSGQVEPYRDLDLRRVDAVLLDNPIAAQIALGNPKFKYVGPRLAPGEYGIGMRKNDADLKAAIDAVLEDLVASGALQAIHRKWHMWNEDQAGLARAKEAELHGLGFAADGSPLARQAEPGEEDQLDVQGESAQQWTIDRYGPLLLVAAGMTVFLSVASMSLAVALGLIVCVMRLYGPAPVRWLALVYVEFFRGIPLLLLLTFLYFGLPKSIALTPIAAAILGFGINYAAYEAEIYRSSIGAVPRGQWEAGLALGMNGRLLFRRIVFPQAVRTALGPMTNDFVAMFKDTSLVSVIAVNELTNEYQILARSSFKFVELGLVTAALYLAMSVPLGFLSRYLEARWGTAR